MNYIKIRNITINLDNVTRSGRTPEVGVPNHQKSKGAKPPCTPFYESSDDPVVLIHHVSLPEQPFHTQSGFVTAFLAYMRASQKVIGEVGHSDKPEVAPKSRI